MKILLLAQCYAPENISGAKLVAELAVDLHNKFGHSVTVVTSAPNYPYGKVFPGYKNRIYQSEILDGVRVIRIWSLIAPRDRNWLRILQFGTYCLNSFYGALFSGKAEVIISYSPPLPLGLTASLLKRIWKVPWLLELVDLYPDAAIAAGILHNHWLIRIFSSMEKYIYQQASQISSICDSFKNNLLQKGIPTEKQTVIPVWADAQTIFPMPKNNQFRADHHLEEKFILLYAGNMGLTSCLEDIVIAARYLEDQPDIHFVLVGGGLKRPLLEEMAQSYHLKNVLFLPYQPCETYPELLAAADIGLVTINTKSDQSSLPSKVFNTMASARPVLAIAAPDSNLANLVIECQCGMVAAPNSPVELAKIIQQMKSNNSQLTELGQNGRYHLENRYSRSVCVKQVNQLLTQILDVHSDKTRTDHSHLPLHSHDENSIPGFD